MRWHKEMLRGFRDNAAYEGGRYVILALLAAAWPIINGFLQKPWYWQLNGILIVIAIILFVVSIIKFSKVARTSSSPKKKNNGLMKPKEPQPVIVAIDELKALLHEGERLVGRFQVDSTKPTFSEVEDWRKRTHNCARQNVLATDSLVGAKDLLRLGKPWNEGEMLRITAKFLDHGCFANGSVQMAVFQHLWGSVERLKQLIAKIEGEGSNGSDTTQRFNIVVGVDHISDNILTDGHAARYHHAQIWIDSGTVHGCKVYLTHITGRNKSWQGQEQLTFSPSEASDTLSKAIYAGVKYDLDVLRVISSGDIHVCNMTRQWPRLPRLHDLFASHGVYDLTLVIAGEDAAAESFLVRFEWTGNWQASFLTEAKRLS